MAERVQNGILLERRAQVVGLVTFWLLVALAELTFGIAYNTWWSGVQLRVAIAEGLGLFLWVIVDPRGFAHLTGTFRKVGRRIAAWANGLGSPASTYRARDKGADSAVVGTAPGYTGGVERNQDGNDEGGESPSRERRLMGLSRLALWYYEAPTTEERPVRWVLLWVFVAITAYIANVLIHASGGAEGSPFLQVPILIIVLGGMMSDTPWHPWMLVGIGIVYMITVVWAPHFVTPLALGIPGSVASASHQRLAYAIVTPVVTAVGVWQSYSAMSYRREWLSAKPA